jgi:thiol peroxidase
MEERTGAVTLKGKPVTLIGPEIKIGQKAPEFNLIDNALKEASSNKAKGKVKVLSVVFSLETPICDTQTQVFDEEVGKYPGVAGYSISMDLPFCGERYRKDRKIKNLKILSDHREASFGTAYGLLVKDMRLLARAVIIVDSNDVVRHVEYVGDITEAPNYEEAAKMLKKVVGG